MYQREQSLLTFMAWLFRNSGKHFSWGIWFCRSV